MFPLFLEIQLEKEDISILRKYCKEIKEPNCYVEIGTYKGGSAIISKTATNRPIYTIDNRDISGIKDYDLDINFIIKDSDAALDGWDEKIGLLFIDGDHTRSYHDFVNWEKHVVNGGYILLHDWIPDCVDIKTISSCRSILSDNRYEKVFIPNFERDNNRILVIKKK